MAILYTQASGTTSQPVEVSANTQVVFSGSGRIEYYNGSLMDHKNNVATWKTLYNYSQDNVYYTRTKMLLRVVAVGGPASMKLTFGEVEPIVLDESDRTKLPQVNYPPYSYPQPVKIPSADLSFSVIASAVWLPRSVGVDGKLYMTAGESSNRMIRTSDGGATTEAGFRFSDISVPDELVWCTQTEAGYVMVTYKSADATSGIWFGATFTGTPTKVVDCLRIQNLSISAPVVDPLTGKTVLLMGEYNNTAAARRLFLSRDGGKSFSVIYTATPKDGATNCHIHHACFDPIAQRIYVSVGDGLNAFFGYTDDWGASWVPVPAVGVGTTPPSIYTQPTVLYALSNAIVQTPDGSDESAGVWQYDTKLGRIYPAHEIAANVPPFKQYARSPYGVSGQTRMYMLIAPAAGLDVTNTVYIVATADGGLTWHTVHTRAYNEATDIYANGITGPDALGNVYFSKKVSGTVSVEKAAEPGWIARKISTVI